MGSGCCNYLAGGTVQQRELSVRLNGFEHVLQLTPSHCDRAAHTCTHSASQQLEVMLWANITTGESVSRQIWGQQ